MSNLTITVDGEALKRVRTRALEEGTSVNAVLWSYLESYAGGNQERREAWRRILDLARNSSMSSEGRGLPRREELYDREVMKGKTER